jgi:hypothetical protein
MWKLAKKTILLGTTVLLPLMAYNYYTDFYGVFHQDLEESYHEPNLRLIKTRYVIERPEKYNQLLFGSSRVGKILAHKKNEHVYNMYYSEGVPAEFLEDLKTMVSHGYKPEKIYVGLDVFSFKILPEKHKNQLLRMPFAGEFSEDIGTYLQLLVDPPKINFPEYDVATNFDYANSGSPLHFEVDSLIEEDTSKHIHHKKFQNFQMYRGKRMEATFLELKQLTELCKEHKIAYQFFFNPVFVNTYLQYDKEEVYTIKRKLAELTSYTDFSGINKITTNPYHYYESSHFRYHIGDSIWNTLSGESKASFATVVDSISINEHLEKETKDRLVWKKQLIGGNSTVK